MPDGYRAARLAGSQHRPGHARGHGGLPGVRIVRTEAEDMTLTVLILIIALVLTIFELVIRSNFRSPIVWAVLLTILALLLPPARAIVIAP